MAYHRVVSTSSIRAHAPGPQTQRRACLTSRHGARVVSCVFAAWDDRQVDRGAADDR
jgi:hypothetical protein